MRTIPEDEYQDLIAFREYWMHVFAMVDVTVPPMTDQTRPITDPVTGVTRMERIPQRFVVR